MSALAGLRILELSASPAGEYCGKLLADFGAEVIKIEKPGEGSATRRAGPLANGGRDPERSTLFAYLNTNKRSVAFDVDSSEGGVTLQRLIDRCDAVIDDHASGWLAAHGLDPETFADSRPALVLCSITPFGASPPEERRHAEDLTVFHASGWGYHTPTGADALRPPLKGPGSYLPSYEAGLEAALCVAAALFDRHTTNEGRFIDISQQAVLASRVDYVLGQMVAGDMEPNTSRAAFDLFGPAGIFRCRDGYAYIWMSAPAHWDGLRQLLGDPAWMNAFPDRWLEKACTPERVAECRHHIAQWLATQEKEVAAAKAQKLGLTLVPVNSPADLQASPQFAHRGFFADVDHPALGRLRHATVPYRLSETPARITSPAPLLGQHTADVLKEAAS